MRFTSLRPARKPPTLPAAQILRAHPRNHGQLLLRVG
jgi:hypothetical protein